ncbi:MAG TPA: twin-arginine translocase TatA/TatE family subunit [Prolixibacteraceae bacterium]|jgi:sec-independent protein translocase protein TatA
MILLAISGGHILIVVVALLLLFGGKKIPELMGGLGKGMKDFKKAIKEDDDTSSSVESMKETPRSADNKREPLKE